jgi:membrane-associated phospholipid phosphatase
MIAKLKRSVATWLVLFVLTSIAVVCSYLWVDRPLAIWIHQHLAINPIRALASPASNIPNPFILIGICTYCIVGVLAGSDRPLIMSWRTIAAASIALLAGEQIKTTLKWIFGRPWPETWHSNNPSFIGNADYKFHWLQGGTIYNSFPSGHMTAVCAVIAVLWLSVPHLRWLWAAFSVIAAFALVASNYHFLGDVIAGAFLGLTVGQLAYNIVFNRMPS